MFIILLKSRFVSFIGSMKSNNIDKKAFSLDVYQCLFLSDSRINVLLHDLQRYLCTPSFLPCLTISVLEQEEQKILVSFSIKTIIAK